MCRNGRNFVPTWFKQYPWLTLCRTKRSAYCIYCRSASKHGLLGFSKNASTAFVEDGDTNWKKARQKFSSHESSLVHKEAKLKWSSLNQPSIIECLSSEMKLVQKSRREAFFLQISALKYILRQGLALRGHEEVEGNLNQLLIVWAKTSRVLSEWLQNKKYMSPQIINELISIMGQSLLRMILKNIQNSSPSWYSIIADEARDVANREQLNLSVRWVDDNYNVSEDPLGLFCLPNTKADTITSVIKDLLIRCALPLSMCRGQAYDGAATMKGKRSGVATQIKKENPSAVFVHCFAHSLNLCLQDVGRKITLLRDVLETVREISKLINFSPKRSHLFRQTLIQSELRGGVSIKPLFPTRWTVRTASIEAVLKDYSVLIPLMEEIHLTTHDEYGLKAYGILHSLEKFETYFGLKLAHLLFGASEQLSKTLQAKDLTLQEALSSVALASSFYKRQRTERAFDHFYDDVTKLATNLEIGQPQLPRQRRPPKRTDSGSSPHQFSSPKEYYCRLYFESCDLMVQELQDRFDQQEILPPVVALESVALRLLMVKILPIL